MVYNSNATTHFRHAPNTVIKLLPLYCITTMRNMPPRSLNTCAPGMKPSMGSVEKQEENPYFTVKSRQIRLHY